MRRRRRGSARNGASIGADSQQISTFAHRAATFLEHLEPQARIETYRRTPSTTSYLATGRKRKGAQRTNRAQRGFCRDREGHVVVFVGQDGLRCERTILLEAAHRHRRTQRDWRAQSGSMPTVVEIGRQRILPAYIQRGCRFRSRCRATRCCSESRRLSTCAGDRACRAARACSRFGCSSLGCGLALGFGVGASSALS